MLKFIVVFEHICYAVFPPAYQVFPMEKFKYVREKIRDPYPTKYSLRREERISLVAEVGVHGLVLFEYYLRLASIEDVKIADDVTAAYFGWTEHTARRHRRALINTSWFHVERAKLNNGTKVEVYYLGKENVARALIEGGE